MLQFGNYCELYEHFELFVMFCKNRGVLLVCISSACSTYELLTAWNVD